MRLFTTLVLGLSLAIPPCVRAQVFQDSLEASRDPLFTAEDALFAGGVLFATLAVAPLDKRLADYLQGAPQTNRFFRRVATSGWPTSACMGRRRSSWECW
jgi:hypothetical protein